MHVRGGGGEEEEEEESLIIAGRTERGTRIRGAETVLPPFARKRREKSLHACNVHWHRKNIFL
jgi:hypothetical protein